MSSAEHGAKSSDWLPISTCVFVVGSDWSAISARMSVIPSGASVTSAEEISCQRSCNSLPSDISVFACLHVDKELTA